MIKLSELENDTLLMTSDYTLMEVGDIKEDIEEYRTRLLYIAKPVKGTLDAKSAIEFHVYQQYEDGEMYEEWKDNVLESITDKDYKEIQRILDKVLENMGQSNIAYEPGRRVLIDL